MQDSAVNASLAWLEVQSLPCEDTAPSQVASGQEKRCSTAGIRIGGLEAFEDGGFDLRNDLSSLTEKGIDVLRTDLAALDIECAEELRKAVHANYIPFIAASQVDSCLL